MRVGAENEGDSAKPLRAFLPIDGLRALLTIWVILFHYERNSGGVKSTLMGNCLGNGYISVGLFFQLSGFLCAINTSRRWPGVPAFLLKRFCRLYPAFWVSIILGVFAELAPDNSSDPARPTPLQSSWSFWTSFITVVAAAHAWIPELIFQDVFNGPTWSVSCEIFFTVVFAVVRPALLRINTLQWVGLAWLATLVLLLAISNLFRVMDMHNSPLKFLPIVRAPQFLLGALLGRMHVLTGGFKAQVRCVGGRARGGEGRV
jgi:peptidoglycan/LPS O-acetylase OafA/YrhL